MAAVEAGTGLYPRLEAQERASQAPARLIRNGQAHRAMRVKFPARFFNRLVRTTTGKQGRMIFPTRALEARLSPAAIQVALGNVSDQFEVSCILNRRLCRRSASHASLARRVLPNLAAYSTKVLRLASSPRCKDSLSFLLSRSWQRLPFRGMHYPLVLGGCQVHRRRCILICVIHKRCYDESS